MATTVLIVDDHPSFRATARMLLEAEGYDVVGEAKDGSAALDAASRLHPQVMLLDINLPDLDGFEVADRMRESTTAIVLISSRDAADYGACLRNSPARGFIAKGELSGAALAELLDA